MTLYIVVIKDQPEFDITMFIEDNVSNVDAAASVCPYLKV
jgi:hypothetical protein